MQRLDLQSRHIVLGMSGGVACYKAAELTRELVKAGARLSNEAFVAKAPPAVLDGARKQLADQKAKRGELERLLKSLVG